MNKCPHCGVDLQENASFCLHCMTPLKEKKIIPTGKPTRRSVWRALTAVLSAVCLALVILLWPKNGPITPAIGGEQTTTSTASATSTTTRPPSSTTATAIPTTSVSRLPNGETTVITMPPTTTSAPTTSISRLPGGETTVITSPSTTSTTTTTTTTTTATSSSSSSSTTTTTTASGMRPVTYSTTTTTKTTTTTQSTEPTTRATLPDLSETGGILLTEAHITYFYSPIDNWTPYTNAQGYTGNDAFYFQYVEDSSGLPDRSIGCYMDFSIPDLPPGTYQLTGWYSCEKYLHGPCMVHYSATDAHRDHKTIYLLSHYDYIPGEWYSFSATFSVTTGTAYITFQTYGTNKTTNANSTGIYFDDIVLTPIS